MKRVLKKLTPFEQCNPDGAILLVNLTDPQYNTMKLFVEAIEQEKIPYFLIGNKLDLVKRNPVAEEVKREIGKEMIFTSILKNEEIGEVKEMIRKKFRKGSKIVVLGIFNSGKTSLISKLAGLKLKISDMPGTTQKFSEYRYENYTFVDTVGQIIDINKPLMVSIDFSGCKSREEKIERVFEEEASAILSTAKSASGGIKEVIDVMKEKIEKGKKIVVWGAGASALVAMEMAGQGFETGLPIICFTNNLADANAVSFAKGIAEEEASLSRYITFCINNDDVAIGISASGGTGFVYHALKLAKEKGAVTVAITENPDTPLGKNAHYIIKSNAKPEGPSSSKIMLAHLAIVHSLLLTLADERNISADESIAFMLPEKIETKKMGIK